MALSIRDPETDRLVRELSKLTGESMTEAVRRAVRERLERTRGGDTPDDEAAKRFEAMMAIARKCAALPVVDDRSEDEILGLDSDGIPD